MKPAKDILNFKVSHDPNFKMIDVGRKRPTRRRAVACGTICLSPEAFFAVRDGTLPKGNVLALAEAAGIMGAKRTPDFIPMCHTLPLDQVTVHCDLKETDHSIDVYVQAAAYAKTGVEMEALAGVNAALLTIWDLTKGIDPDLLIEDIRLLIKTGGKSGVWTNPRGIPEWLQEQLPTALFLSGKKAGILVMSDRASSGAYEDLSGALLKDILCSAGADVCAYDVIPDRQDDIAKVMLDMCHANKLDILIASGGTGPGPRDVTPDVLARISDRVLDGIGDFMRMESLHYVDTAWLSRMTAGMIGSTLVIAFPGSPKAVQECWEIIGPYIGDALDKIRKQGFEV
ncbi:bifunctional molybdenum cofactor biosynthesis protein MoaC/MoaB [Micavibrio aeruginosavorus]|uniref:cyclic pyranopterin monophosphate synthase n=1 Tax=Micavibrio aeruginosavorus EPB TaxID=349215 RepID=M4VE63_9BACT|nr:bifunctional molybdenum cofactor biosynthesis protein MoaC/MoaB [Micavibrio aeruginosavorus]AGH97662.1 Molybdenum cofactor biosynthesis protein MoaC [Micavibrio aeruginosavorus EPB]